MTDEIEALEKLKKKLVSHGPGNTKTKRPNDDG